MEALPPGWSARPGERSGGDRMASLLVLTGAQPGLRLPLRGDKTVLGRDAGCDIVIDEAMLPRNAPARPAHGVSRKHAIISCIGDRYYIEDGDGQRASRNGTFV